MAKKIPRNPVNARKQKKVDMDKRRSTGSFYTPYSLAKYAWMMIVKQLGENFWQKPLSTLGPKAS